MFTRVGVGLLVDAGKLRLDDPVRRHLPELPESFAAITVEQLLQHRSGVAPMTRPDMADGPTMAAASTARELVSLVASKPLSFEPGREEQYSNGGYLLLGALIEAVRARLTVTTLQTTSSRRSACRIRASSREPMLPRR